MNIARLNIKPDGIIKSGKLSANYDNGRLSYEGSVKVKILGGLLSKNHAFKGDLPLDANLIKSASWQWPGVTIKRDEFTATIVERSNSVSKVRVVGKSFTGHLWVSTQQSHIVIIKIDAAGTMMGRNIRLLAEI